MSEAVQIAIIISIPAIANWLNGRKITKVAEQAKATEEKVDGIHGLVNSRMTELLELTRQSSKAEGIKQEQDKQ
jgi:hypothetical protein